MALGAIVAVLLALFLVTIFIDDPKFKDRATAATLIEGLTIFAVFFVGAAGIERLLEPIATIVAANKNDELVAAAGALPAAWTAWVDTAKDADAAPGDAAKKQTEAASRTQLEQKLKALADAQGALSMSGQRLQIGMWALASVIGIVAAASLKLYLLSTVGIAAPSRGLEVLATGLIIGAGTKPLHDLTKLIEAKKDAKQDEAAGTA